MPGPDAHCRVSVARCKPCTNPHDTIDLPRYLPSGLTQYVLNNHTAPPILPPHVTADDVSVSVEHLKADKIFSHRSVPGRGGAIAVLYETRWKGLPRPSWEREADLLHARQHILEYSGSTRPCNLDRQTGYTAACAWVPLNTSSPAPRAPASCLLDIATPIT